MFRDFRRTVPLHFPDTKVLPLNEMYIRGKSILSCFPAHTDMSSCPEHTPDLHLNRRRVYDDNGVAIGGKKSVEFRVRAADDKEELAVRQGRISPLEFPFDLRVDLILGRMDEFRPEVQYTASLPCTQPFIRSMIRFSTNIFFATDHLRKYNSSKHASFASGNADRFPPRVSKLMKRAT